MNNDTLHALKELADKAKNLVAQDEKNAQDFDPITNPRGTEAADVELNVQAWDLLKALAALASSKPTLASVLAEHENHRVHVHGAWTTDVKTVDTINATAEELHWQYKGFSVYCLRCKTSLSQQWN